MKTVEFKFDLKQEVKVKALEMVGRVDGLCQDINGEQYRIVHWNEGIRYTTWMYDWEIEASKNCTNGDTVNEKHG